MEAVLTRPAELRVLPPTWVQVICAVIYGSILSFLITFVLLVFLFFDVPVQFTEGMTGRGWPWRIEGPWSLAADLGPLLLSGAVFAYGVESFLYGKTGVHCWRAPIALVAVVVGWVTAGGVSEAGLLATNGAVGFIAVVIVSRVVSVRERPALGWTRARAVAALAGVLTLALASISYGLLHPLSAGTVEQSDRPESSVLRAFLHNDGDAAVQLVAVTVPGVAITSAVTDAEPVAGAAIAGEGIRDLELGLPGHCASAVVDRLHVRLRVHGRELTQVVRLAPPVTLSCP